jgi:hypothetical protein
MHTPAKNPTPAMPSISKVSVDPVLTSQPEDEGDDTTTWPNQDPLHDDYSI